MSADQEAFPQTEPQDISNDNAAETPSVEDLEKKLKKLHERLPLLLQHIRDNGNPGEMENAFVKLQKLFKDINNLEMRLLKDGETYTPLSLMRLYEMAVSGGSGSNTQELEQAYLTTIAERDALLEAVESLTFSLGRMKGQAADEIIDLDKSKKIPTKLLRQTLVNATASIDKIRGSLSLLEGNQTPGASGQSIDQKILEAIGNFDDLTSDLLRSAPKSNTMLGRLTRQFGLAYDYKDIAAARQLVQVALKANQKLAEISDSLLPLQEKIGIIHKLLDQIEVFAGHDDRQNPQYKSALEEIDRLNAQLQRIKDKERDIEGLDKILGSKRQEIELQESVIAQKTAQVTRTQSTLNDLKQELEKKIEERKALEARPDFKSLSAEHASQILKIKELQASLDAGTKEKERLEQEIRTLKNNHQSELAILRNKFRLLADGLLVEKLENEILKLREIAKSNHEALEKEKQLRVAFEDKIGIWLKSKDQLETEVATWQKRSALKAVYLVAAAGGGGLLGLGGSYLLANNELPLHTYLATMVLTPAITAGACTLIFSDEDKIKSAAAAFGGVAILGGMMALLGMAPVNAIVKERLKTVNADNVKLLEDCTSVPCMIVLDKDGKPTIIKLSDKYKGERVGFDFTNPGSPNVRIELPKPGR